MAKDSRGTTTKAGNLLMVCSLSLSLTLSLSLAALFQCLLLSAAVRNENERKQQWKSGRKNTITTTRRTGFQGNRQRCVRGKLLENAKRERDRKRERRNKERERDRQRLLALWSAVHWPRLTLTRAAFDTFQRGKQNDNNKKRHKGKTSRRLIFALTEVQGGILIMLCVFLKVFSCFMSLIFQLKFYADFPN